MSYAKNRGKGYALKKGVLTAKNEWILTTDSDCSVSNMQLIKWIKDNNINNKIHIYFGSRNLSKSKVETSIFREIIGTMFIFFIKIFFRINLSDTQCGYKLYKTVYAKKIFKKIFTHGYMHDIEICIIANKLNLKIKELPVKWSHTKDSKINFLLDFIKIILSLYKIKNNDYK